MFKQLPIAARGSKKFCLSEMFSMFLNDLWFYFILNLKEDILSSRFPPYLTSPSQLYIRALRRFFFYYFLRVFLECVSNDNVGLFSFKIWNKINSKVPVYAEINMCFQNMHTAFSSVVLFLAQIYLTKSSFMKFWMIFLYFFIKTGLDKPLSVIKWQCE